MKKIIFILACFISLSCSKDSQNKSTEFYSKINSRIPPCNTSTPESVLKSYWKLSAWSDTTFTIDTNHASFSYYTSDYKESNIKFAIDNIKKNKENLYFSKNQIDRIEKQSEERVIIYTKELSFRDDKDFDTYKYVIIKQDNRWLIDDALEQCWNCKGTGKARDYTRSYSSNDDPCTYCKGLGWNSKLRRL